MGPAFLFTPSLVASFVALAIAATVDMNCLSGAIHNLLDTLHLRYCDSVNDNQFVRLSAEQLIIGIVLTLITFGPSVVHAQAPRERHEQIRSSVESHDYSAAIDALVALRSAQPDVFAFNNYDYLLARLSERTGDRATAVVNYQRIVARESILSEYAIWHLAQFARITGNLTLEREHLRQLLVTVPKSELRDAAWTRLGQSYLDSGDFDAAIYEFKQLILSSPGSKARESLSLLGQAYLRNHQLDLARETFNKLINDLADPSRPDDFALASARGLDAIDSGSEASANIAAPQLPEAEHWRRAKIYHFNRDFARARLHYVAIVRGYQQSTSVSNALYQLGRSYYQDGMYEDALANLTRLLAKYPESDTARDAQSLLASFYGRMKRTDEAVAGYRRYMERYSGAPEPERPYLNIIDVFRDAGRDQEALDWIERTRETFKGQLPAALALFSRTKIYLAQNNWTRALSDLEALSAEQDLGGTSVPGGTSATEVSYLRAFVLEELGKTNEAVRAYLEIPDGRNEYYGGRATERLRAMAGNGNTRSVINSFLEIARQEAQKAIASSQPEKARIAAQRALRLTDDQLVVNEMLDIARRAYATLPSYSNIPAQKLIPKGRKEILTAGPPPSSSETKTIDVANELLFLGLYDEGAPALALAENFTDRAVANANSQTNASKSPADVAIKSSSTVAPRNLRDEAYTLAVFFNRGDLAEHAIRYAEPLWKNVPRDYLLALAPREFVELLYPAPYSNSLNEYAPSRGVDPRFVLSIMRQESRFRPDAKSASAARGLMQFIPSTANTIATQLGKQNFQNDDLYNPRVAILFGSAYLGSLFKLFPGMPDAVAASYNGGEESVARWVARARSNDPDRYVPEIGFAQSKDYVYKVMANYRVYQQLYSEELQTRK